MPDPNLAGFGIDINPNSALVGFGVDLTPLATLKAFGISLGGNFLGSVKFTNSSGIICTSSCTFAVFESITISVSANNAVSYSWSFGDTTTSTDQAPVKRWGSGGVYAVSVTVTFDNGDIISVTDYVTIVAPSVIPVTTVYYRLTNISSSPVTLVLASGARLTLKPNSNVVILSGEYGGNVPSLVGTFLSETIFTSTNPNLSFTQDLGTSNSQSSGGRVVRTPNRGALPVTRITNVSGRPLLILLEDRKVSMKPNETISVSVVHPGKSNIPGLISNGFIKTD